MSFSHSISSLSNDAKEKGAGSPVYIADPELGSVGAPKGFFGRLIDDFRPVEIPKPDPNLSRRERAIQNTTVIPLRRSLSNRHLQMIAIGGSIGAGLFVSSGNAMLAGGPGGMLIGYSLVGILLFTTMTALGELGVRYPVNGVFSAYTSRFLDSSLGFAIGWNYCLAWLLSMPTELNAAAVTIGFWKDDDNGAVNVNKAAWIALFWSIIAFINVFGVRGYGEAEVFFSMVKVTAIIGFIIFAIVVTAGGGPTHEYLGGRYWHDPGSFSHGVKGVFNVFVSASYAFTGTEFAGLAAVETDKPHRALPRATRQVFVRILLFYIISIIMIGFTVPFTDPHLGVTSDGTASPFVIAIRRAGVGGLPSVMNVVIIFAVLSVGNSAVFGSTRTVVSLAAQGLAPSQFLWIDKKGRPVAATILALLFGLLGFIAASSHYKEAFNWMSNTGGLAGLMTWMSINGCHIRNRIAMRYNNVPLDVLEYKAPLGIYGSIVGLLLGFTILGLMVWVSLFPEGEPANVKSFFESWLSFCIILALYLGHKLWYRDYFVRLSEVDIHSGVLITDPEEMKRKIEEDRAVWRTKPFWYRTLRYWC